MSLIHDLPTASSISLSDELALQQSTQTSKVSVEGLANKVGEVIGRNDNLFLNGHFKINQRGLTDYPSVATSNRYTVDRWKTISWYHRVQVSDNGITITHTYAEDNSNALGQTLGFPLKLGRAYTLSVGLQNGEIYYNSGVINNTTDTITTVVSDKVRVMLRYYNGNWVGWVNVDGEISVSLSAIKLEVGSVSTLAYDVAPNYSEELAKCRWYFRRVNCPQNGGVAFGFVNSTTLALIMLAQVGEMRVVPTLSASGSFHIMIDSNTEYVVTLSLPAAINKEQILVKAEGTGMTAGKDAMLYASSSGAYIDLDAEIY